MPKHALEFVLDNQSLNRCHHLESRSVTAFTQPDLSTQPGANLGLLCRYLRLHFEGTHVQQTIIDVGSTS